VTTDPLAHLGVIYFTIVNLLMFIVYWTENCVMSENNWMNTDWQLTACVDVVYVERCLIQEIKSRHASTVTSSVYTVYRYLQEELLHCDLWTHHSNFTMISLRRFKCWFTNIMYWLKCLFTHIMLYKWGHVSSITPSPLDVVYVERCMTQEMKWDHVSSITPPPSDVVYVERCLIQEMK